ncbi:MAG: ThuA domain-containing protein [Planctomycetaceae bacterium]|nr:ThuA domain-containing protein [Planctomycetaceae bacterium]
MLTSKQMNVLFFRLLIVLMFAPVLWAEPLQYKGTPNLPGNGKHVVLVSGDEEYRSEEAVVQLGRILAKHHGFDCTILFAINPETGEIDPVCTTNIPNLHVLATADVLVVNLRFRNLPDEQMQYFDDYFRAGKPVLGMRTSTHAFRIPKDRKFARYGFDYHDDTGSWEQGFGRKILGETWIDHHGHHGKEATRGIVVLENKTHPIVRGCGDIFGLTDVYRVRLPLSGDSVPLVLGQVLEGMKPTDKPVAGSKNNPMMPIAWTKTYKMDGDTTGNVFTTTMGSSQDLESEGLRRLLVNAVYWLGGLGTAISERANVGIVGNYETLPMGFGKHKKGMKPENFAQY